MEKGCQSVQVGHFLNFGVRGIPFCNSRHALANCADKRLAAILFAEFGKAARSANQAGVVRSGDLAPVSSLVADRLASVWSESHLSIAAYAPPNEAVDPVERETKRLPLREKGIQERTYEMLGGISEMLHIQFEVS